MTTTRRFSIGDTVTGVFEGIAYEGAIEDACGGEYSVRFPSHVWRSKKWWKDDELTPGAHAAAMNTAEADESDPFIPSVVEFGTVLFETVDYTEFVVASNSGVTLVACMTRENVDLYRVDYTLPNGSKDNAALYTFRSAIIVYRALVRAYGKGA